MASVAFKLDSQISGFAGHNAKECNCDRTNMID
jgi:hypothetical protein